MSKILMTFILVFSFLSQSNAVEMGYEKNTENPGVGKPLVLTIDGGWRFRATLYGKIIACYDSFSAAERQAMQDLFEESIDEMRAEQEILVSNSRKFMFVTLSSDNLHEDFVKGPLKSCLSKK